MSDHALASAVQWIVWGLVMAAVMGWVSRSRSRVRPPSEAGVLVQPVSILFIGVVSVVFWLAIAVISNTVGKNSTSTLGTTLAFCSFALASTPLISGYYLSRHHVSETGMDYGSMFGSRHTFTWAEVRNVRFSPGMGWFKLETESGFMARISTMLMGLPEFARLVLTHVQRERFSTDAYALLEAARGGNLPKIVGRGSERAQA